MFYREIAKLLMK